MYKMLMIAFEKSGFIMGDFRLRGTYNKVGIKPFLGDAKHNLQTPT